MARPDGFRAVFQNSATDASRVLQDAVSYLKRHTTAWAEIEVALAEALQNIVDHAYLGLGMAELTIAAGPTGLRCRIRDQGMAYTMKLPHMQPKVGQVRGRGWTLIHGFCQDVRLKRDGTTNQLDLFFANKKAA